MKTINNPLMFPSKPEQPKASSWLLILEVCGLAGLIKIILTISEVFATLPTQIPVHYARPSECGPGRCRFITLVPACQP